MTAPTEKIAPITITDLAAQNIQQLLLEKGMTDHCLRIYVAGIGCSGPQYGLALDKNPREDDTVISVNGVQMLVDPNSLVYLDGATVDYVETPQGSGFKIENPNPLAAAGCRSCAGSCG